MQAARASRLSNLPRRAATQHLTARRRDLRLGPLPPHLIDRGHGGLPETGTQVEALWAIAAALERLADVVAACLGSLPRDD